MIYNNLQNFGYESDSTYLTYLPGTTRIGNKLTHFDGTRLPINSLSTLSGLSDASKYQYCLTYLKDINSMADMTKTTSITTSTIRELSTPSLPYDSTTGTYSPCHPLNLFTLYTPDGTNTQIINSI